MASQGDPTQRRPSAPPPQAPPPAQDAGIDLTTLFLSAVASAAAAYVTSKIWAPGTLFSAAMSPVIVALVKEGLRKPTEVVTAAVPAVGRPLRPGSPVRGRVMRRRSPGPPVAQPLPDDLPEHFDAGAPPPHPPPQAGAEAGPVRMYSTRGRRLRWRLAVLTGLLGFAICVVVYTLPEIITGKSVGRAGQATTFFPGKANKKSGSSTPVTTSTTESGTTTSTTTTTQQNTTTEPAQTVTDTVTTPAAPPADTTTTPAAPAPAPPPTTPPAPQAAPPTATTP
jgi:hypothetical protein